MGRDVNRHNYTAEEIEEEINRDVVKRLLKLIKFRNEIPIFDENFSFQIPAKESLILKWEKNNLLLEVNINLKTKRVSAEYSDKKSKIKEVEVF